MLRRKDPRLGWLRAEIADFIHEPDMSTTAAACLEQAVTAVDRGDVNAGWAHLYRAREEMILTYGEDRVRIVARSLAEEIKDPGRLPAWRAAAIRSLLAEAGAAPAPDPGTRRKMVAEALKLRDDGIANDYWRLSIVRHYQTNLLVIGAPTLTAVVFLLARYSDGLVSGHWNTGPTFCVLAVLLGVLGAMTSAIQRSTRIRRQRVTVQLGSYAASFSRIPIGAVAGLTVWLFSIATANAPTINAANLLLAAFGAGFAERLIVQGQPGDPAEPDKDTPR